MKSRVSVYLILDVVVGVVAGVGKGISAKNIGLPFTLGKLVAVFGGYALKILTWALRTPCGLLGPRAVPAVRARMVLNETKQTYGQTNTRTNKHRANRR